MVSDKEKKALLYQKLLTEKKKITPKVGSVKHMIPWLWLDGFRPGKENR